VDTFPLFTLSNAHAEKSVGYMGILLAGYLLSPMMLFL